MNKRTNERTPACRGQRVSGDPSGLHGGVRPERPTAAKGGAYADTLANEDIEAAEAYAVDAAASEVAETVERAQQQAQAQERASAPISRHNKRGAPQHTQVCLGLALLACVPVFFMPIAHCPFPNDKC
jgi:hypothetical protein